jgi:hypothetical protein
MVLWSLVWRHARDDLTRFLTINALLFGIVFSWLEEPGYTLFVMAMIALLRQQALHAEPDHSLAWLAARLLPRKRAGHLHGKHET